MTFQEPGSHSHTGLLLSLSRVILIDAVQRRSGVFNHIEAIAIATVGRETEII